MLPHWEWDKLAWQTLPPGGLGINRSPASFLDLNSSWSEWWWCEQGSSNEPAWDCLTNSSRLVDFCSSSNSFYGLNSSTGLSPPCTHRCVDHPTDLCLIRSPTCSFGPLSPSWFTLTHSILQPSIYLFSPSLSFSLCDSLRVVGQKLLQGEGVFLLRVDGVPPAAGEADPRVVLGQLGHIPWVCHHLERKKRGPPTPFSS